MMLAKIRYSLKVCRIANHILYACAICLFVFPWANQELKQRHIQRWSRKILDILNIGINMNISHLPARAMVISNHVSWLDIFVINSLSPCRFVAKSNIRSWPLMGWIAGHAGAIYISRGNKADVRRIYHYLIEQIEAGERIAFFPEGTVSEQGTLLPFHANLFEAAIHAKVPIQPVALRYVDASGELHPAVAFNGVPFAKSIVNVLNAGAINVELNGLEVVPSENVHRRDLATVSRQVVAAALQAKV